MDARVLDQIVRNQLLAVGPLARWRGAKLLRRGYVPSKNSREYVTWVYENLAGNVKARRALSGTVLELGPGGNLGCSLLFLANGCDYAVCIDVFPFVVDNARLYQELVDDPKRYLARTEYRSPESIESTSIPDSSCDVIFSAAVLEHVADPLAAVRRIAALLKPGGVTTHGIDLRDHRNFEEPLAFLRYSQGVWRAATSRRVHTNRWRASDWASAFQDAGLVDVEVSSKDHADVTSEDRSRMHARFRGKSLDDLSVTQIELTATRPPQRDHKLLSRDRTCSSGA